MFTNQFHGTTHKLSIEIQEPGGAVTVLAAQLAYKQPNSLQSDVICDPVKLTVSLISHFRTRNLPSLHNYVITRICFTHGQEINHTAWSLPALSSYGEQDGTSEQKNSKVAVVIFMEMVKKRFVIIVI